MTDIGYLDARPAHTEEVAARPTAVTAMNTLTMALGVQIAFLIPSLIALAIDERLLIGVSVWSKPLKFETSLIVAYTTLLLLLPLIDGKVLSGRTIRWAALASGLMGVLEIFYIIVQAARGRASHFNNSTPLEAVFYGLMGVGAVTIVIGCMIIGWMLLRHGRKDAGVGVRLGGAWGLMIGGVLTIVTAGVMSSGAIEPGGHWVGGVRSDAGGLFLFGWSTTGGDLRVPHFFATHLMQGLPILGLLMDRLAPRHARAGPWIGGIAGIALVAATFIQAALGRPFL
jgi:hypothetical protein